MRKRTKSRECALQILYAVDIGGDTPENIRQIYWENHQQLLKFRDFADRLIEGVWLWKKNIDTTISNYAENWDLGRMAIIDRNVLRISTFELLYFEEVPAKVSINEAVNLVKKFSTADSGKFVNGILDKIKKEKNIAKS